MSSRKIEALTEETQKAYWRFDVGMKAEGIEYLVTCTTRTQEEQDALYEQGRSRPGRIVTWTKNSRHKRGEAFDIVILENGKPDWSVTNPKWTRAGEIGIQAGLSWSGRWASCREYPHMELKTV